MSEALVPAAVESVGRRAWGSGARSAAADRRRRTGCSGEVSGVLRGADREREDAGGVRAGHGAVPGVVRGPRPRRLGAIAPLHVAAYIRTHPGSVPTVKQHLAAIRVLCDWLVVSQVLRVNPAAAVRGPKHVVTKSATPVLTPAEGEEAPRAHRHGHAGRAPRPGALLGDALQLRAGERGSGDEEAGLLPAGEPGVARLHEKGGKRHDIPAHHRAAEALDEYLEACGLEDGREALFQSVDRAGGRLTGPAVDAAGGAGHDQAPSGGGGAPAVDLLPHVSGDGDHGVSVERRNPRARTADRRARVTQDDEALRPDGGQSDRRRDRTDRDLNMLKAKA